MLYIGIHIGPQIIRLSQAYPGRGDPVLEDKTIPNYGLEEWYTGFQGAIPNRCDKTHQMFGYDALKNGRDADFIKLDQDYFRLLLEDQKNISDLAYPWRTLLDYIRRNYVSEREPMAVTLFLENMVFQEKQTSRFRFWEKRPDRSPELAALLLRESGIYGIESLTICNQENTITGLFQHLSHQMSTNMLLTVDARESLLWNHSSQGDIVMRPVSEGPGYLALEDAGLKDQSVPEFMHTITDNETDSTNESLKRYEKWKVKISATVAKGRSRVGTSLPVLIAGEGAKLLVDFEKSELIDAPEWLYSRGAALHSYSHSNMEE